MAMKRAVNSRACWPPGTRRAESELDWKSYGTGLDLVWN